MMQWWWKPVDKVVQTVGPGEAAWGGTVPPHTSASVPLAEVQLISRDSYFLEWSTLQGVAHSGDLTDRNQGTDGLSKFTDCEQKQALQLPGHLV